MLLALVASLLALALPVSLVLAGTLTLHPAGFGEKSYAAWKAQEGLDDPGTNPLPQQALYFQKLTATETFAAGVAVFKGFAGIQVSDITGLEWKHRNDGWCGAGAPRWNVISEDTSGTKYIIFEGCAAAGHSAGGSSVNKSGAHTWVRDVQPAPATQECRLLGPPFTFFPPGFCATFTLTQLAIVFDEGTTQFGVPLGPGFVHLDEITVTTNQFGAKTWYNAASNGNQAFVPGIGPAVAYALGDDLVPVSDILADLQVLFPGVPVTDFNLYPDVLP
jgi:hypothetical protein